MRSTSTGDRYRVVIFDAKTRHKVNESGPFRRLACAQAERDNWNEHPDYTAAIKVG